MSRLLSLSSFSASTRDWIESQAPHIELVELPSSNHWLRLETEITGAEILHLRSRPKLSAEEIAKGKKLKLIALGCSGYDHIDLKACASAKIPVIRLPRSNAKSVAELSVGLILQGLRKFSEAQHSLQSGKWERERFTGEELAGKTVGLLGLGEVGSRVARRLQAFEPRLLACDPYVSPERFQEFQCQAVSLDELLLKSDIVSLHCPLTSDTQNLLNRTRLAQVKPGLLLINTARGGLIDDAALLEALAQGQVGYAALDVFSQEPLPLEHPFRNHPQIFVTPHLASRTNEAQTRMERDILNNILHFLRTGELIDPISPMEVE